MSSSIVFQHLHLSLSYTGSVLRTDLSFFALWIMGNIMRITGRCTLITLSGIVSKNRLNPIMQRAKIDRSVRKCYLFTTMLHLWLKSQPCRRTPYPVGHVGWRDIRSYGKSPQIYLNTFKLFCFYLSLKYSLKPVLNHIKKLWLHNITDTPFTYFISVDLWPGRKLSISRMRTRNMHKAYYIPIVSHPVDYLENGGKLRPQHLPYPW